MDSTEELKLSAEDPTKDTLDVGTLDALKHEADRCMTFSGYIRGASLEEDTIEAIKHKEGEGSAKKIEEKLKEIGHPIDLFEFQISRVVPVGLLRSDTAHCHPFVFLGNRRYRGTRSDWLKELIF
ncbi:MAG: hypothetical protein U5L75_02415 [Candidatus Campbellbacteria bacterium]|nr:hypothetical protein [Candidatus Campbellbacteria bacterium]